MRRFAFGLVGLFAIVACSSGTTENAQWAGAQTDGGPKFGEGPLNDGGTVDSDATQSNDASNDASASAGDSGDDSSTCVRFGPPPSTTTSSFGTASSQGYSVGFCPIGCGAGGAYYYKATKDAAPALDGCTQLLTRDGLLTDSYCCSQASCTLHANYDQLCAAWNPGHPKGYLCYAPAGSPRPTRAGCEPYAGPGGDGSIDGVQCCF